MDSLPLIDFPFRRKTCFSSVVFEWLGFSFYPINSEVVSELKVVGFFIVTFKYSLVLQRLSNIFVLKSCGLDVVSYGETPNFLSPPRPPRRQRFFVTHCASLMNRNDILVSGDWITLLYLRD